MLEFLASEPMNESMCRWDAAVAQVAFSCVLKLQQGYPRATVALTGKS